MKRAFIFLVMTVAANASESDLYGDGKFNERWNWLVDRHVITGTTVFDRDPAERALYVNAFTYAMKEKIEAWKLGRDIWWSPLLVSNAVVQRGYYDGTDTADRMSAYFMKTRKIDIALTAP